LVSKEKKMIRFSYLRLLKLWTNIIFCIFIILSSVNPMYGKGKEPEEVLSANVRVNVDWNIEQGNTINKGRMTLDINDCMRLDRTYTKEVKTKSISSFFPFLIYKPQSMIVQYTYAESLMDKEPGKCPPLAAEYIGNGVFSLSGDPYSISRANLYIRKIASMIPGAKQMESLKDLPGLPDGAGFCDYYEFLAGGPKVTIHGRIRRSDCTYKSDEKEINICKLGIRFQIPDDGKMVGKREWSTKTKTGAPPLKITLSDLPASMKQAPYEPESMAKGDVNYSVKWSFGEVDLVLLFMKRKVNGNWEDVEDNEELKEVVVGEKIELKGVVVPKDKDPNKGKWVIDGNDNKNYIKKYKVAKDHTKAEAISLKTEDLNQPEIGFYWFKGKKGSVKYTTIVDGKEYSKEAEFTIRKPEYTIKCTSSVANHFGITTNGDTCLLNKWPDSNRVMPEYKGKLGKGKVVEGLEYNGILFSCESQSDIPGKTQWVQIINNCQFIRWYDKGVLTTTPPIDKNCEKGLDMVYPCARNNSFYDAPAIPTSTLPVENNLFHVKMLFDLYLMFKPEGKENEWVPLKKINWKWAGGVEKVNGKWEPRNCFSFVPYKKKAKVEGEEPTVTEATEYPTWEKIVEK
jgi:hypothetical protein